MEILLSCLALFLLSIGGAKLFSLLFINQNTQSVKEANQNNENKDSVFLKKYKEVDIDRWQTTNKLIGLVLALSFLLFGVESFTKNTSIKVDPNRLMPIDSPMAWVITPPEELIIPPKEEIEVPPPPKPPVVENIEEVEVPIEEDPEIELEEKVEVPAPVVAIPMPVLKNPPPSIVAPSPPPVIMKEQNDLDNVIEEFVQKMPEFEKGINDLRRQVLKNYNIPGEYINSGEKGGKISTRFVVLEDGTIGKVEIIKGLANCDQCDEEAIKAIKRVEGKFSPGKQAGKPVKVWFSLPIEIVIR